MALRGRHATRAELNDDRITNRACQAGFLPKGFGATARSDLWQIRWLLIDFVDQISDNGYSMTTRGKGGLIV